MTNPVIDLLSSRRSVKPDLLQEPGPSQAELETILTIAARVPDHKKLAPWRFIVFEGEARARAGDIFAQACLAEDAEPPSSKRLELERGRLLRAPMVIAVVSKVVERPGAPEWEQVLSAGASAFNLCVSANALGFGRRRRSVDRHGDYSLAAGCIPKAVTVCIHFSIIRHW